MNPPEYIWCSLCADPVSSDKDRAQHPGRRLSRCGRTGSQQWGVMRSASTVRTQRDAARCTRKTSINWCRARSKSEKQKRCHWVQFPTWKLICAGGGGGGVWTSSFVWFIFFTFARRRVLFVSRSLLHWTKSSFHHFNSSLSDTTKLFCKQYHRVAC